MRLGPPSLKLRRLNGSLVLPLFFLVLLGGFAHADDWRGWRGLEKQGVAAGKAPVQWGPDKNVKWKTPIPGEGHSSPVVDGDDVFVTTAYFTGRGEELKLAVEIGSAALLGLVACLALVLTTVRACRPGSSHPLLGCSAAMCMICTLLVVLILSFFMATWEREPTTDLRMEHWLWASCVVALCLAAGGSKLVSGRGGRAVLGLAALGFAAFMVLGRPSPEYFNLQGDKRYAREFFQTLAMPCGVGIVLLLGALWTRRDRAEESPPMLRRIIMCGMGFDAGTLIPAAFIIRRHMLDPEATGLLVLDKYTLVLLGAGLVAWAFAELVTPERKAARLPRWLPFAFLFPAALLFYGKNHMLVEREFVRAIVCVDRDTGSVRWTAEGLVAPQPPLNRLNSPATPTPLVLGDRVVAWFGSAGAMCVDRKGNELWTNRDLPFEGIHGVAASPMPAAGRIIISSGQPKAPYLAALDPKTGDRVWTTTLEPWGGDEGQHRTPTVLRLGGRELILQWGWEREEGNDLLWAFDAGTGKLAWEHPAKTHREAVASMVVDGDRLILPSSREIAALSLSKLAAGEPPELWKTDMKRKGPHASTPVVVNGLLFTASNRGHTSCLDVATGELLWGERLEGKGTLASVAAPGESVIFCDITGRATVVAAERTFRVVAANDLAEALYASPAPVDGRLYLRTESHLWCFEE